MFELQYEQWAGSGVERNWKRWAGPFDSKEKAENALAKNIAIWPNDSFKIVELVL